MNTRWDLLVVGGGTAGIVAAKTAARFGARVVLVERARTGGDCLWTGCVPSKSLLAAASAATAARDASRFGVHTSKIDVDFGQVMDHVRAAIRRIEPSDSVASLRATGVHVETGTFTFTGAHQGTVDGRVLEFRQAVICAGSAPAVPPVPGLSEARPLTSDTIWDLDELPARLAVLGGGNIGAELGQAYARLGSEVTIVEAGDRILGREDEAAAAAVALALTADGVKIYTGSAVERITGPSVGGMGGVAGEDGALVLEDGTEVGFTHLLVAAGRTPPPQDLGLDAAGVEVDDRGYVKVDSHLRTSNEHVWAAGDVTGGAQFTHVAGVHGSLAATNAVLGIRRSVDATTVLRVTFTHPEVAAVGVSTDTTGARLRVLSFDLSDLDRAITEATTAGFTRIVVDRRSRIVGATVVGPRAGEALTELTLAMRNGMRTSDLAGTTHPYPTFADAGWNASIGDVRGKLSSAPLSVLIKALMSGRRRWLDLRIRQGSDSP